MSSSKGFECNAVSYGVQRVCVHLPITRELACIFKNAEQSAGYESDQKNYKDKDFLNMEQIVPGANFCRLTFQKLILVQLSLIKLPCLSPVVKKHNVSFIYSNLGLERYGGKVCQNKRVLFQIKQTSFLLSRELPVNICSR